MLRYLYDLRVRTKLILILLIPLVSLVALGAWTIMDKFRLARETRDLQKLTAFSVSISALVHETQRERGATGVFLGKHGAFATELQGQRARTDAKITALRATLGTFAADSFGADFEKDLGVALSKLDAIYEHRLATDAFDITGNQGIDYYTDLDALFLRVIGHISQVSSNAELARRVAAYEYFLQAKEKVGVERATMTVAFGQDRIEPAVLPKFFASISTQDLYGDLFQRTATPSERALYARKMQGHVVDEAARMRRIAISRVTTGGFDVDAAYWYTIMTAKIDTLKEVEDALSSDLLSKADALQGDASRALSTGILAILVVTAASIFMAVLVSWGITRPLSLAVATAEKIATGDLTTRIESSANDEPGKLLAAMRQMTETLTSLLVDLAAEAAELSSVADSMSVTSRDLSTGTNEEAASVKETAVSLQEISVTVANTAKHCERMEQMAVQGAKEADQAGRAVRDAVDAMKSIASRIAVVEEIAARTNLLAINATIEAAGAQEHGRQFGVVATEVRKLAENSRTASREIRELASAGLGIADKSGQLLVRLVPSIQTTAGLVKEVALASKEEATGISQVQLAMSQIETVTRQTAGSAREMHGAAQRLEGRARHLRELIAFFTLAHKGPGTPRQGSRSSLLPQPMTRRAPAS